LIHLYDYDQHAPLDLQQGKVFDHAGIKDDEISYASPKGGRVSADLVVPPGQGPFAGMVFMHPGESDRSAFLPEALTFAGLGVVSILIDAPFVQHQDHATYLYTAQDREDTIRNVIELRRAVDVLLARRDVDTHRIGFVGFSYGADSGAILAGVEKRIRAYALWSGEARVTDFLRSDAAFLGTRLSAYLSAMEPLNAIYYIGHAAPAALLFQNGRFDQFVPQQEAQLLYQAASNPKVQKWYDADHGLNDTATQDRQQWLSMQLGLKAHP
jgi:dienelactone hydrolase